MIYDLSIRFMKKRFLFCRGLAVSKRDYHTWVFNKGFKTI